MIGAGFTVAADKAIPGTIVSAKSEPPIDFLAYFFLSSSAAGDCLICRLQC